MNKPIKRYDLCICGELTSEIDALCSDHCRDDYKVIMENASRFNSASSSAKDAPREYMSEHDIHLPPTNY